MSIPNTPVAVGDVLAGKYRTERLLGMGNMGVVVEATHLGLNQRVALKFLLAHRATTQAIHERFLREARAVVGLRSQHVTRVSDVGTLESGAPYMVMELLDGRDLDATLEERRRLPIQEAVEYVLQACEAVGEAHRAGIVHRDLKPANLFLTKNADGSPCVKVLDFGVSKISRPDQLKLTTEGQAVGSPLYMSPEQMQGRSDVDARADVWALGVILYELVAGVTPFHTDTMLALSTNVLVKPPTPMAMHVPNVPPAFEAVIFRCLQKAPEQRWSSVAAFAAALVPFAPARAVPYAARVAAVCGVVVESGLGAMSLEPARSTASEPGIHALHGAMGTTTGATSQAAGVPPKRRLAPIAAGSISAVTLCVLAIVGVTHWRGQTKPVATAAEPQAASVAPSASSATATTAPATSSSLPQGEDVATATPSVAPANPTAATSATASAFATVLPPAPQIKPKTNVLPRQPVPKAAPQTPPSDSDLYKRGTQR